MPDGKILINDSEKDIYDDVLLKKPWILELFCALNYSLNIIPEKCPEYEIFNLANKNSVIINLNHDELAKIFIKKEIVDRKSVV